MGIITICSIPIMVYYNPHNNQIVFDPHNNLSTMALLKVHVYYCIHGDVIICCYILNRPREKHLQFEILYTIIIVVADQLITGRSWRHVEIYYSILFLGNWQCQLMNKLH